MGRELARALRNLADRLDPPRKLPIHHWHSQIGSYSTTASNVGKVTWRSQT